MTGNRKSITITRPEFEEWKKLKQKDETWGSLLRRIRMGWNDLKVIKLSLQSGAVINNNSFDPKANRINLNILKPPNINHNKRFKRIWFLWPLPLLPLISMLKQDMRENIPSAKERLESIPEEEVDYRNQLQAARIMQAKKRLGLV